jgi:outer membrane protein
MTRTLKTITSQADPGLVLAKLTATDVLRRPTPMDTMPVTQAIQVAMENRPEMKQARLALNNAEIDTDYTKNQTLPVLDLNAGYTQNGLGGVQRLRSALGGTTITGAIPGGIADALGQVFSADYKAYSFGFNLQIPLTNRAAKGDYDRALSGKRLAQAQMDATAQQIALDVRNAMNLVDMSKSHIESAAKARELAQETLDAEQQKYDLGISILFFVLQAQTNLAIAQTNEIQAMVSYTKSLAALDSATGQTLFHNHIEIEQTKPRIAVNAAN